MELNNRPHCLIRSKNDCPLQYRKLFIATEISCFDYTNGTFDMLSMKFKELSSQKNLEGEISRG